MADRVKKKKPGTEPDDRPDYLHGFSDQEQKRLYKQARFLEWTVFGTVDLSSCRNLIEVGCGVGAQTEILLERFPHLRIEGIDASPSQVATARKHLAADIKKGRVYIQRGDALHLPFKEDTFDAAFLCWFLEHVKQPVEILAEVRRVLNPGGTVYCNEVMNAGFYANPYSPATIKFWFEHNDHQWCTGGDPFVGAKLANHLMAAGYQNVETQTVAEHYDNRMPKRRAQAIDYWTELLLSAAPALKQAKRVSQGDVDAMVKELALLKKDPNSVFYVTFMQAKARVY